MKTTEQETAEQRSERLKREADKAVADLLAETKFGKVCSEHTVVAGQIQHVRITTEFTLK